MAGGDRVDSRRYHQSQPSASAPLRSCRYARSRVTPFCSTTYWSSHRPPMLHVSEAHTSREIRGGRLSTAFRIFPSLILAMSISTHFMCNTEYQPHLGKRPFHRIAIRRAASLKL
ncbi:hypothetical protein P280DRAFT_40606 [Massarina eburnea CBS 473.64]|uniref:Uncharacterized protein n=1 Tax=Massarina eburnea CBS 473.64 TaxID=1395130 RepID=A0A6A6RVJ4_9PLEO|nr:hypothetical protein P280DRAFT_40606 [Massarina eburnea CBS 473.64]